MSGQRRLLVRPLKSTATWGLGPGLLESAYEECLACEMGLRKIPYERQKALPLKYKGLSLDCGYRLGFVVANCVVIELKAIKKL